MLLYIISLSECKTLVALITSVQYLFSVKCDSVLYGSMSTYPIDNCLGPGFSPTIPSKEQQFNYSTTLLNPGVTIIYSSLSFAAMGQFSHWQCLWKLGPASMDMCQVAYCLGFQFGDSRKARDIIAQQESSTWQPSWVRSLITAKHVVCNVARCLWLITSAEITLNSLTFHIALLLADV